MDSNETNMTNLIMNGTINLNELKGMLGTTSATAVTLEDWGISYDAGTGQLSEYCTAVATDPGNPITGIGMLAYSGNGAVLYGAQYTNGFSSETIGTSIGTTLFNPDSGTQALCIVYGWTDQSSFYITQTMTIAGV